MINFGTQVEVLDAPNIGLDIGDALSYLAKMIKNEMGTSFTFDPMATNAQARNRFALLRLENSRSFYDFKLDDLHTLYELCIKSQTQRSEISELYSMLIGHWPVMLEDALGLRTSLRGMFIILWANGKVTLPYTFTTEGAFTKFPLLEGISKGFIFDIASKRPGVLQSSRIFQYRTNWHSAHQVSFDDAWNATPFVCALQGNKSHDFRYTSWLELFSSIFPENISAAQHFYLEKYHQHLYARQNKSATAIESAKTYEEFKAYYNCTPEQASTMTAKEREQSRREYQAELARKNPTLRLNQRNKSIEKLLSDSNERTPEDLALLIKKATKSLGDFGWLNNKHYLGREHIDIENLCVAWKASAQLFMSYLKSKGIATNTRNFKTKDINMILDYIFCYLPIWFEHNPDTLIKFPEMISDFERVLFWNNHISEEDRKSYLFKVAGLKDDFKLPLTALQFYLLAYSKKTQAAFVSNIHEFFEFCRAHKDIINLRVDGAIDTDFTNPVNISIDRAGSGSRGTSDKVALPLDSTIIAKAYIQAINDIGIEVRNKILASDISPATVDSIKGLEWIELEDLGLSYTMKIQSSVKSEDYLEIPLIKIANVYSWYKGMYTGLSIPTYIPWISTIRMLSIALYAGLRMQNCQWLDLRSFDRYLREPDGMLLSSCMMFVNTDKNGKARPSVVSLEVMRALQDEKEFQTKIYTVPVKPVFYENDASDPQKYGLIQALFRSPWTDSGLPFSDGTYTTVWPKILLGIEEIYNAIVPEDRHHTFATYGSDGKLRAIHTPHALRATWITHMKIYGHLKISIIQGQVAHENDYTTNYYVVPNSIELMEQVNIANSAVESKAWQRLHGVSSVTAHPISAISREWSRDRNTLAKNQNFISVTSAVIDSEVTGMQLIATTAQNPVAFYTNCVCVKNGKCPKQLISFTGHERICGLCPIAIFGVDHLPGINCIMRSLAAKSEQLVEKLRHLKLSNAHPEEIEHIHHELTVSKLELASYYHISQLLNKHLESSKDNGGMISRLRDLNNYVKHDVDMNNPAQRVIAQVLDSSLFPQFAADGYPHLIQKIAKSPELLQIALSDPNDRAMYTGQILTIMSTMGISLGELSTKIEGRHIKLMDAA